jgi:aminopeptidase
MNILLVEKVGGSFHLALGNAYTFNEYAGNPVKVDNGNRSLDHWDITTMLIGKQGVIELDGKPIMKDGLFLDPKLDILNRGWAAIPEDKRPDYWKSYKGPKIS